MDTRAEIKTRQRNAVNVHPPSLATPHAQLEAALWVPEQAVGVVVLAGEAGRHRARPTVPCLGGHLSMVLREARLATLVLGTEPGRDAAPTAESVREACDWLQGHDATAGLPLGLAGIGEGASAALQAAAGLGRRLCALVARSARWEERQAAEGDAPLARITAPTLLLAGGLDASGVAGSRRIYAALRCPKRFEILVGATRAFDECGSVEVVARLVRGWFVQHVHRLA
ncbi:MAG TPA: alpha/beta hydrolase [Noviherbaspirillum sp.]